MRLLIIDGNSIISRVYYGIRPLTNKKGIFTNAIFGFMNMYLKVLNDVHPDGIAVAFPSNIPTFRQKAYEEYQFVQKNFPDELAMQIPYLKQILQYMGIACISADGFDTQDILGTLANHCDQSGDECVLLTGDVNNLQLITDRVTVDLVKIQETIRYTPDVFRSEYGFEPSNWIDIKSLTGDRTRHIPGVKGIGEKTARNLIQVWSSIECLYANLKSVNTTDRVKKFLQEGKSDAEISKFLVSTVKNVPISINVSDYIPKEQNTEMLSSILMELELYKLMERLHLEPSFASLDSDTQENSNKTQYFVVIDTETNWCDDVMSIGMVIANKNTFKTVAKKYYILTPEYKKGGMFSHTLNRTPADLTDSREKVLEELIKVLQEYHVDSIFAYNASFDYRHLPELQQYKWFDILKLAAYQQYNPKIPASAECWGTGRLKRNYGVEPIMRLLSGKKSYSEVHNALCDAVDELKIMKLLDYPIEKYDVTQINAKKKKRKKSGSLS